MNGWVELSCVLGKSMLPILDLPTKCLLFKKCNSWRTYFLFFRYFLDFVEFLSMAILYKRNDECSCFIDALLYCKESQQSNHKHNLPLRVVVAKKMGILYS